MKVINSESSSLEQTEKDSVSHLLDVVPAVMRVIRGEMRRRRPSGLSVPQFRTLIFINRRGQVSLSGVADHTGLTLPTVSKMVEKLVRSGWISRVDASEDRRRAVLRLTKEGELLLKSAYAAAHEHLREMLKELSPAQENSVVKAMAILRSIFLEDGGRISRTEKKQEHSTFSKVRK